MWFPKIWVPLNHPILDGIVHYKPSSYGGTPIDGNLHISTYVNMIRDFAIGEIDIHKEGKCLSLHLYRIEARIGSFLGNDLDLDGK